MCNLRSVVLPTFLVLGLFGLKAQIINPDFNDWHWVTLAQPYLDPTGWTTNNYNQFGGVACTPIDRASDSTGYYAHISSSGCGVDAVLSGVMSQRIPAKHLSRLNIVSKCDSLWGTGSCVISLIGKDYSDVLYTDSIWTEENEFQTHSIDIPDEWIMDNDSITIQLTAKGIIDMWDEEEDGYSVFLIHRVTADQHFLVPGRQWIYEFDTYAALPNPLIKQSIETITIEGDTVINGLAYYKLIATLAAPCGIFDTTEYLREEGGKIFRLSKDHTQEFLLIDFDETASYPLLFEQHNGGVDTGLAVIDSFGTEFIHDGTQIDVQYLRILNNQSYDDDTPYKVYRNVGFVQYGLLFPDLGTGLCDVMEGIQLRCYVDGLDTLHFTGYGCYESTLMEATTEPSIEDISLSPNPTADEIRIPEGLVFKDLYNVQGQVCRPSVTNQFIDLSDFPEGYYILRFVKQHGREVFIGKILKL